MPHSETNKKNQTFDRELVEGPILKAVWKLAWPTVVQSLIAGLQGIVDHAMVGHYVGYTANAAIGVSWQIFIVIIVFVNSLYTGMGVLVARFAGAGNAKKVNAVVYQAFLTSILLSIVIMAPLGYFLAPQFLDLVNAADAVQLEALPYLRIILVFSFGLLVFYMLTGALRAAGDSKTPLRLGIVMTVLNLILNVVLIQGAGPIPAFGTRGAAMGTVIASGLVALFGIYLFFSRHSVVKFSLKMRWRPDWQTIASLFRFGLPVGVQGVAVNVSGVLMLGFIGSLQTGAEAQAAYTVVYIELFSLVTWTSVGLLGATSTMAGQNIGAGKPERSKRAVAGGAGIGLLLAIVIGATFLLIPKQLLGIFAIKDSVVAGYGVELLQYLSLSGLFITVALAYTGGLQGAGDTRSPLYISIISQILIPLGYCFVRQAWFYLEASDIWLAIVLGHATRAGLSYLVFHRGKWVKIKVE